MEGTIANRAGSGGNGASAAGTGRASDAGFAGAILAWVGKLASLVQHRADDPSNAEKLALFAEMLAREELPAGVFCNAALHAVLRGAGTEEPIGWWSNSPFEIARRLRGWWTEHHPKPQVQGPQPSQGVEMTKRWFSTWPCEGDNDGWQRRRLSYWERDRWLESMTEGEQAAIMGWLKDGLWTEVAHSAVRDHPVENFRDCSRIGERDDENSLRG